MPLPVSRHAALTTLALAIAAPAAFADNLVAASLSPVIVTATRTPQAATDVLSDNVYIGPEEIARAGVDSVIDLLQKQRGIEVTRNGGPGTTGSVFIRGANSKQNIVLIDGVRIGSSTTGEANWSAIPLSAVDHIEIVYGPLSTLYGADALGGVIQIFTKKGSGAPRLSGSVGAGSYRTGSLDAAVAGSTGGEHDFSYALGVGKEKANGYTAIKPGVSKHNADADGYDKQNVSGQFGLQLAKGHEVGLLVLHSRLDSQYDNGPVAYDARNVRLLQNVAAFSKNAIAPNWASQFQVAQARDKLETFASASDYSLIRTLQTDVNWQNDIRLGADMLQILFNHRKEEVLSSSSAALTRDRSTKSVAASYSVKRERHLLSVGARNDDSSQYGSHATGSLGYGYRLSNALRAGASFGTSFRAPTFNELYDPSFGVETNRPEKARNAETGLYFDDGVAQWSAVYYHNRVTDLLVTTKPCPVDPVRHAAFGCAYNVDQALLEGVTLAARRQFGNVNLSGNLDLQDPRNETTGKALERRAKRRANLAADYAVGALTAGAELQLSGKRFDKLDNKDVLGGYSLLNLYATYQLAPQWRALVRWDNVSDKRYELAKTYATTGSSVFVALQYGMK